MIAPSTGGETVIDGESCDVCCIVLAPKLRTEGEIGNCFVASHDTAPCGGGIFLRSWQCTIIIGESKSFCIPSAQPVSDTTKYGPIHAESSLHFFARCNNATPSLLLQIIVALLYGHTVVFGVAPPDLNVGVPVHMLPLMHL